MQKIIESKLTAALAPTTLEVVNESALHAGHAGHAQAGGGDNTHFRVRISAPALVGKSRVEQHRMIYAALGEEFRAGIHALAIEVGKL